MSEWACDEIERLEAELEAASKAIDDLNVQCKFWRQAAEHAVNGWNALEDKVEAAREILDALEGNAFEARTLLGSSEEWAPPELSPYASYEVGGVKLRVVEEESPLECCKLVESPLPWCRNRTACISPNCTCLSALRKRGA